MLNEISIDIKWAGWRVLTVYLTKISFLGAGQNIWCLDLDLSKLCQIYIVRYIFFRGFTILNIHGLFKRSKGYIRESKPINKIKKFKSIKESKKLAIQK